MAEELGIDFDDTPLQPIVLADADGVPHTFGIRPMLVATGHELVAEKSPRPDRGGYRFAVLGDVHADSWDLFQRSVQLVSHLATANHALVFMS